MWLTQGSVSSVNLSLSSIDHTKSRACQNATAKGHHNVLLHHDDARSFVAADPNFLTTTSLSRFAAPAFLGAALHCCSCNSLGQHTVVRSLPPADPENARWYPNRQRQAAHWQRPTQESCGDDAGGADGDVE